MLRSRKCFQSAVENRRRPAYRSSRTSRFDQLNGTQCRDRERPAVLFLSDHRIVGQIDFRVEAARQHPLVVVNDTVFDAHVFQLQTRQSRQEGIALRVQPGRDNVDDLHHASFAGTGLEQFLLPAADRPVPKLPLNNLQSFLDFFLVDAGTVTAQGGTRRRRWARDTGGRTSAPNPCGRCIRQMLPRPVGRDDRVPLRPFNLQPSPSSCQ